MKTNELLSVEDEPSNLDHSEQLWEHSGSLDLVSKTNSTLRQLPRSAKASIYHEVKCDLQNTSAIIDDIKKKLQDCEEHPKFILAVDCLNDPRLAMKTLSTFAKKLRAHWPQAQLSVKDLILSFTAQKQPEQLEEALKVCDEFKTFDLIHLHEDLTELENGGFEENSLYIWAELAQYFLARGYSLNTRLSLSRHTEVIPRELQILKVMSEDYPQKITIHVSWNRDENILRYPNKLLKKFCIWQSFLNQVIFVECRKHSNKSEIQLLSQLFPNANFSTYCGFQESPAQDHLTNRESPYVVRSISPESKTATNLILYKAEKRESISEQELLRLAQYASLEQLGLCAQAINQSHKIPQLQLNLIDSLIELSQLNLWSRERIQTTLDAISPLADGKRIAISLDEQNIAFDQLMSWKRFKELIRTLATLINSDRVMFLGIKPLWLLSIREKVDFKEVLGFLKAQGLKELYCGPGHSEEDLTISEIQDLHEEIYGQDLYSSAKAEIVAPFNGKSPPFWERFCRKLSIIRDTHDSYPSHLTSVEVAPAPDANLSFPDFLRAVALTRIFLQDIPGVAAYGYAERGVSSLQTSLNSLNTLPFSSLFGANMWYLHNNKRDSLESLQDSLRSNDIQYICR